MPDTVIRNGFCERSTQSWEAKISNFPALSTNLARRTWIVLLGSSLGLLQALTFAAEGIDPKQLVTHFWMASSVEERERAREQLMEAAADVGSLYGWLKAGPSYANDVPVGQQESARVSADGIRFPYVFLVPESYDPLTSYPVEFLLHGGVSRPEWEAGGSWWRRGYDSLKDEDKIIVVPAAWNEAFWWQASQADSLPDILRTLKQTYNIDDNRVTLTGISDGGTGVYFFAFKQPTEWAAFLPYIGHPGVLRNTQSGGGYRLFFENLLNKPLYIVNGEDDPLYPVSSVMPFIEILRETKVDHTFRAIPNGGHNTRWLPAETPMIEQFKLDNPRDPLPETVQWVTDRTDRYNRNHWIRIDERTTIGQPAILQVSREANNITVVADGVTEFTLLLNPEEIDFTEAVRVTVNGSLFSEETVKQDMRTLLNWAQQDFDRSMLFTAELTISLDP